MCGIAGIISSGMPLPELRGLLKTVLKSIRHRGPDDEGMHIGPGFALGMRRLSIIDLEGGHQPMVSDDEQTVLVYNGEIYNFQELRLQLETKGHYFRTNSDSEVILHGYREWKEGIVERLRGMFAFAIFDGSAKHFFLARDQFGIKPLYYYEGKGFFAFCSEPQQLLSLPGVSRKLDPMGLAQFVGYKYVPSPNTFIDGMSKLGPGTLMRVDGKGRIKGQRRYWQLEYKPRDVTAVRALEDMKELLFNAVRRHLISDVPVGVFLSGGIDSGLLLWAARECGDSAFTEAYTVGFDESSFDESALAIETATHLGVRHHLEKLPVPDPDRLDEMVDAFGEPFANVSIPANFLLSEVTARHVKVALNGSGADELFGGYERYYLINPPWLLSAACASAPVLTPLINRLPVDVGKHALVSKGRRFMRGCQLPVDERHAAAVCLFPPHEAARVFPFLPEIQDDPVLSGYQHAQGIDDLQRSTWVDIRTMMADDYLTLMDRTSMAASLEVRVPFLDVELAELAFSLPASMKMKGWHKKVLLRQLAKQCLPRSVTRSPKQGFESPVGVWFRGSLGDRLCDVVCDGAMKGVVDASAVSELVRGHQQRRYDAAKQLLAIYTLSRWMERNDVSV